MKYVVVILAALVLVLGYRSVAADPPSTAPVGAQRWEYRVELMSALVNPDDGGKTLQELGAEGWELTATVPASGAVAVARAFFKRPLK